MKKDFYPNIKKRQRKLGFSDKAMADALGLDAVKYESKLKNGNFTLQECRILCVTLNHSFDYLFAAEQNEKATEKADAFKMARDAYDVFFDIEDFPQTELVKIACRNFHNDFHDSLTDYIDAVAENAWMQGYMFATGQFDSSN